MPPAEAPAARVENNRVIVEPGSAPASSISLETAKPPEPVVLSRFTDATRAWFTHAFAEPTPAQIGAWDAISAGDNALVVAPTGSGKTLSAFLWALDRLVASPPPEDPRHRCRVLYVSPLKALAVDVELKDTIRLIEVQRPPQPATETAPAAELPPTVTLAPDLLKLSRIPGSKLIRF